jgi:hypothetical protein
LTPNPENWFEQEIVKVLSSVFIDPSPGSGLLKGEVDGDTKAFRSLVGRVPENQCWD